MVIANSHVIINSSIVPFNACCFLIISYGFIILSHQIMTISYHAVSLNSFLYIKRMLQVPYRSFEILKVYHTYPNLSKYKGSWSHLNSHLIVVQGFIILTHDLITFSDFIPAKDIRLKSNSLFEVLNCIIIRLYLHLTKT